MTDERATVDSIVATLRPALREKVTAALGYTRKVKEPRSSDDHGAEQKLWGAALDDAGLGVELDGSWSERPIPLASELTPEQRQLAEIAARTPGPYLMEHRMPAAAWVRRQWLGIDPPGPLFRDVDGKPLFHAVRAALLEGDDEAAEILLRVPEGERTAALCDLRLSELDAWSSPAEPMLKEALPDLGKAGRAWAIDFADRLLRVFADDQPAAERSNLKDVPVELARAAFVSLLRAGVAIEPRWDALLPLAAWMTPDERTACILAIPGRGPGEARREAALARALGRIAFTSERLDLALSLLGEHPYAAVAAIIVDDIDGTRDTEGALAALRKASATNPAVADVVKPLETKLARRPRLRVAKEVGRIQEGDLDVLRTKQLESANAAYGGKRMTAAQIFATPDDAGEIIMPSLTRLLLLVDDKGKPAYDAWLYMGDSGSIFKAGTTKHVASIVQGGLQCSSLVLRVALKDALAGEPAKAKASAKSGAKRRGRSP